MRRLVILLFLGLLGCLPGTGGARAAERLTVGVTLLPYYSFTVAVAGDHANVVPLIPAGFNPHNHQPQPEDLIRATQLDALVINGVGHDAYALKIVEAAGMKDRLAIISANRDVSLLPVSGLESAERVINPHTFIGVASVIPQVYTIAEGLAALDPAHATHYRANARAYAARLRKLKAAAMAKVSNLPVLDLRCAAVHGSYDYLLQEFGLQVALVVEPAPGLQPSAAGLQWTIEEMRRQRLHVLFAEEEFPAAYVDAIERATGVKTRFLKHLTAGTYTPEAFEEGLRYNLEQLTSAITDAAATTAK